MDIADRQKMDEALRQSEEKFRQLAESTEAIMWEFDILIDRWTYVAPQSLRILGYAPEEWTNLQFWTDHLHPEDRDWASQYCAECTERGEKHIFEYRFLRKDGGITWLRDIVSVEMVDSRPVKLRGFMIEHEVHKLNLTSDFCELKRLQETVSNIAPGLKEGGMFVACLIELVANAIEHGNRFDPGKKVNVEIIIVDEFIQTTVQDQGEGFPWREKIDRPLELDGSEERGRGIAMTRICCDRLFYNEKGNRVTFAVKQPVKEGR